MISEILRDHGLGKGISGTDKQALINLVNAADANQSSVKTNIANSLNAVSTDKALGLTSTSTWAEILTKITQVKTGKKWATGRVYVSSSQYVVTVTGLTFTPSFVLIVREDAPQWGVLYWSVISTSQNVVFGGATAATTKSISTGQYVQNGGFSLDAAASGFYNTWLAFE